MGHTVEVKASLSHLWHLHDNGPIYRLDNGDGVWVHDKSVQLAGLERSNSGRLFRNLPEHHLLEEGGLTPVVPHCIEAPGLPGTPLKKLPRTGGRGAAVGCFRSQLPRLFLRGDPSRDRTWRRHQVAHGEVGHWVLGGDPQGEFVNNFNGVSLVKPVGRDGVGPGVPFVAGHLLKGPYDIFGGHLSVALVKLDPLPKVEDPGRETLAGLPGFRQKWLEGKIRIMLYQLFVDLINDVNIRGVTYQVRIKGRVLGGHR